MEKLINTSHINKINILYANIRSMRNKIDELEILIKNQQEEVHIIVLNETWLYSEESEYINLNNYVAVHNCRDQNRGGGTAIFIKEEIPFTTRINNSKFNTTIIELTETKPRFRIATLYRPPDTSIDEFVDHLDEQMDKYKNLTIIGDFNINLLNKTNQTQQYLELLELNNYKVINQIEEKYATRETETSQSIIDHVITNYENLNFEIKLESMHNLDHKLMHVIVTKVKMTQVKMTKTYYTIIDKVNLKKQVKGMIEKEQNLDFQKLEKIINEAKEANKSLKKIRTRQNEWITHEILQEMKLRNKLYLKAKNNENQETQQLYKNAKNKVNRLVEEAKQNHLNKNLERTSGNARAMWKVINKNIKNKTKRTEQQNKVNELKLEDKSYTNPNDVADILNNYFVEIGQKLAMAIDKNQTDCIENKKVEKTLFMNPTDSTEVEKIIKGMKKGTAPGPDGITVGDLLCLVDVISQPLSNIINNCIENETFPNELKNAIVIPIHKNGSKDEPGNYRPITLLNLLGKIYEKVIKKRLVSFVTSTGGFDKQQFGFQEKSNTEAAIINTLETITENLDKGHYVCAIFVDLKKAFDTVNHKLLLKFLEEIGIRGKANKILESYLTNRTVNTKNGNKISSARTVTTGVPQGSVLGPILYLIYIQNIQQAELEAKYTVFADDTILLYNGRTKQELESTINRDLVKFQDWLCGNRLTINTTKTEYIIFKQKNKQEIELNIRLHNAILKRAQKAKYLGTIIDEKLTWTEHIQKIKKKILPLVGVLHRCGKLTQKVSDLIYNAHIETHIRYNCIAWSQGPQYNIKILNRILNKAIKILYRLPWRIPTQELYHVTNKMDVNQILQIEQAKIAYKMINNLIKHNISLQKNEDIHHYNTRRMKDIHKISARTEKGRKSIKASVFDMYNKLPHDIKISTSYRYFMKKVKEHIKKKE